MAAEKAIWIEDGWEAEKKKISDRHLAYADEENERSKRRARANIHDLSLCSGFEWFVTLTLSAAEIDRYDYDTVIKKLGTYCSNRVQRNGLRYILVPERHKDGAIHFHGFFAGLPRSCFTPSGTYTGGNIKSKKPRRPSSARQLESWIDSGAKEVYNIPSWKYGYTTAVELSDDYDKAVSYVSKYISKSEEKVGGRWYLSGGDLHRPETYYTDLTLEDVGHLQGAYTFGVAGCGYASWRGMVDELAALSVHPAHALGV